LNAYYVIVLLPRVPGWSGKTRTVYWIRRHVAPFALAGLAAMGGARAIAGDPGGGAWCAAAPALSLVSYSRSAGSRVSVRSSDAKSDCGSGGGSFP
jgi:hypothetical protein